MPVKPRVDLHAHSTASDGTLSPVALAAHAADVGLAAFALTDHDSVAGVAACSAEAAKRGIGFVPGVELSADWGGRLAHVLGYFVDAEDESFEASLAALREGRRRRIESMAALLTEAGLETPMPEVLELAAGGSVGRAHLARVLVARGWAIDTHDAFDRFIGKGRPCWVRGDHPTPRQVIATIRAAGGLPVLAHPALSAVEALIPELAGEGLVGVEAYHPGHTPVQVAELEATAARLGLLVTGGTDYHGPGGSAPELGTIGPPEGAYEALLLAAGRPTG